MRDLGLPERHNDLSTDQDSRSGLLSAIDAGPNSEDEPAQPLGFRRQTISAADLEMMNSWTSASHQSEKSLVFSRPRSSPRLRESFIIPRGVRSGFTQTTRAALAMSAIRGIRSVDG